MGKSRINRRVIELEERLKNREREIAKLTMTLHAFCDSRSELERVIQCAQRLIVNFHGMLTIKGERDAISSSPSVP